MIVSVQPITFSDLDGSTSGASCPHPELLKAYEADPKARIEPGNKIAKDLVERTKLKESVVVQWAKDTREADELVVLSLSCSSLHAHDVFSN